MTSLRHRLRGAEPIRDPATRAAKLLQLNVEGKEIVKTPKNEVLEHFWRRLEMFIPVPKIGTRWLPREIPSDIPGITVVAVPGKKEAILAPGEMSNKPSVELQLRGDAWRKNAISKDGHLRVHLGTRRGSPALPQLLNKGLADVGRKFRRSVEKRRKGVDENPISSVELQ